MGKPYAIITFRDTGPLKTWAAVRSAQAHNSRERSLPHTVPFPVRYVIGTSKLIDDVKASLRQHGIDPAKLRKNGVIAYEAVLTASPSFFKDMSDEERPEKFRRWYDAQKEFLLAKYGAHRVVSLVLHLDESTPHLHAVILPLTLGVDGRSKHPTERWALVGRTICGPGEYDRLQDEYAKAMEPLGLVRGERKSGRKHKPVRDYMADLEAQAAANQQRATELAAELARVRQSMLKAEVDRRAIAVEKQALAVSRNALAKERAEVAAERQALKDDDRRLGEAFAAFEQSRATAIRFMQMVKRFPESRWSPETVLMAGAAREVGQAVRSTRPEGGVLMQQAWMLQQGGRGR